MRLRAGSQGARRAELVLAALVSAIGHDAHRVIGIESMTGD
ncbi:hypothetical protein CCP4SC76_4740002 [Gammaproteobacteria bacterium]